jgi:hypothetical protein
VSQPADNCTFFYENGNANAHLGTGYFVHKGMISATKRVEFITAIMSYIITRGRWCDIIVLNVHEPTEDESEKLERVLDQYYVEIVLRYFNAK